MPEFSGVIERRDREATFDVELVAGVQYIIDLVGAPSPLGRISGSYLNVFTGPDLIFSDYGSGPSGYAQAVITPVVTETYSFDVSSYDTGGFLLRVFADDYRGHPQGVAPAGSSESAGGSAGVIDHAGDTDIHQVALIEGLTYEIEVLGSDGGGGSLADPELRLRDSGGRTIAADNFDSGAGSDDLLEFTPEASGRHYVDVRGFGTGTGSYQVAVSEGLGTAAADMIDGTSSADAVDALGGEDRVSGAKGDDMLLGGGGSDELKGGRGDDVLTGGLDADTMTGGGGADVFAFTLLEDSTAPDRDTILPGSKGVALGKPGAEAGDLIDLTAIDADATLIGDQAFVFGSIGTVAGLWLVEEGDLTVVRASVDADADAEFELAISDGSIRATDYASDDFAL